MSTLVAHLEKAWTEYAAQTGADKLGEASYGAVKHAFLSGAITGSSCGLMAVAESNGTVDLGRLMNAFLSYVQAARVALLRRPN